MNNFLIVLIFTCCAIFYSANGIAADTNLTSAKLTQGGGISENERSITYVGNAGFLINIGDKKILIDALFKGFEGSYELPQHSSGEIKTCSGTL